MTTEKEPIYIVDGVRTPFIKAKGQRGPFSAADLGVIAASQLFLKNPILPTSIDEVVAGCVMPSENEANIARIMGLRLGCGEDVPAFTVARNCGAGMQAVDSAMHAIQSGRSECVLVIGTEAMSRAPLICSPDFTNWMGRLSMSKTTLKKLKTLMEFRFKYLNPTIALLQGLTDPMNNLIMGKTAEEIAFNYQISRTEMDIFSVESHQKAVAAWDQGRYEEVIPLLSAYADVIERDDGIRPDISLMKLANLKSAFEKYGTITAGNSSQVTDGAGAIILASESFVKRHGLQPLAVLHDISWSGCNPTMMGLGPVRSMSSLLTKYEMTFDQIDTVEINEAFAAQVLGVLKSFDDPVLGQQYCHITDEFGSIAREKLNPCGGAIALGHPIGASGIRIILRAIYNLRQQQGRYGMASLCIGGGQGGAALVEVL
jgi:acetyl-CoA C-acetyltransferase